MKKFLLLLSILLVGFIDVHSQASFNTGALEVAVNSYGRVRLFTPDSVRHLQRASILVGTSATTVFDYQNDADTEDPTELVASPVLSDFEIYGSYNNQYSSLPPDVLVKLNVYGWTNSNYVILKYNIKSNESNPINAIIGLDIIPELNQTYGHDSIVYNSEADAVMFRRGTATQMGFKLLSAQLTSLVSFEWFSGYTTDDNYWTWLNNGYIQSVYGSNTDDGPVTVPAQDAVVIQPGESVDVFYAFSLGQDESAMLAGIAGAVQKYQALFTSIGEDNLNQLNYDLSQNYPNPFNPSTKINFSIKQRGNVAIKVYDVLGNHVSTLINEERTAGNHSIEFNATNLVSGIYFYTISADGFSQTKKMILIK
ncbi:MAG TPA: T9SS type A sorting domain-containing protein [Ignavibacteriaceae bacterium]|mgnify:CR=1 FL=1|nr:T9SS type A sorting domain-containing protein [Ignavibacteriaceae bacterium]